MIWINIISFYLVWFLCISAGAGKFSEIHTIWISLLIIVLQLAPELLNRSKKLLLVRLGLILKVTVIGILIDLIPVVCGLVVFPRSLYLIGPYPVWLILLWCMLATSLWLSLKNIVNRLPLSALFGLFGGPLSYLAAEYYGAISFPSGRGLAIIVNSVEWGVLMVCFRLIVRTDSIQHK